MKNRFVCLANSFKEGGKCLAGVLLDEANTPIKKDGRCKWIRPVTETGHGEIPMQAVSFINILDIVEADVEAPEAEPGYQSENMILTDIRMQKRGRMKYLILKDLTSFDNLIFGSRGKAIEAALIDKFNNSLMLIRTEVFKVYECAYPDNPHFPKTRIKFQYRNNWYDLPVTDPFFLVDYKSNPSVLDSTREIYLTISLGVDWNNWHYKLIAGVIYSGLYDNPEIDKEMPF